MSNENKELPDNVERMFAISQRVAAILDDDDDPAEFSAGCIMTACAAYVAAGGKRKLFMGIAKQLYDAARKEHESRQITKAFGLAQDTDAD